MQIIAATGNKNKLEEFRRILAPLGLAVLSPAEIGMPGFEAEETGKTFAENAYIKARALFRATGKPALADDSGLCIDALNGRPGVYSARYCGEDTPYPEKMQALLEELREVPLQRRTARFVCAICCVLSENDAIACEESCEGKIGLAPAGTGGFGYDPLFYRNGRSFAELTGEEKDAISHRGKALRRFAALARQTLGNREDV